MHFTVAGAPVLQTGLLRRRDALRWASGAGLLVAGLSLARHARAQNDVAAHARQVFAEVNGQLARYARTAFVGRRPGVDYSAEGRVWSENGAIRKIEVIERDDSGDVVSEFYFSGTELVFLFESIRGFAPSGGATRQVTTGEERLYFRNGSLVRWISGMGQDKRDNPPGTADFVQAGRTRIAAAGAFRQAAQKAMASAAAPAQR